MAFKGKPYGSRLIVREYAEGFYKVVQVPFVKDSGWEFDSKVDVNLKKEDVMGNGRYRNNVSRAKSRFFEYAVCNPWDFFVTFTFDGSLCDRYSFDGSVRAFLDCVRLLNKYRSGSKISYLLVPEQHKDGAWHMHGFLSGLKSSEVRANENGYMEWIYFRDKFGFMNMSPVENPIGCAFYSTKYVCKSIDSSPLPSGAHLYYHSRNLSTSRVVYSGSGCYLGSFDFVSQFGIRSSYVSEIDSSFFNIGDYESFKV